MRLKKLLRKIDKDTYVSIGFDGDCVCTCKVSELDEKMLECRNKVVSVGAGVVYGKTTEPKVNIFCKL